MNSPDTAFFNKSQILYGYDKAKQAIRKHNFSILVEGQFDVIMAHVMGYTNTVATSGTAITDEQLGLLARLSSRLVIALDADGAGFKASEKAWHLALHKGMDVKIATLPEGKDPADLALENPQVWKEAIKNAQHIIDFLTEGIAKEGLSGRELARALHQRVIPYIARLESSIEQAHFVDRIAGRFGINKDALWQEVSGQDAVAVQQHETSDESQTPRAQEQYSIEQQLIGILEWQRTLASPKIDVDAWYTKIDTILGDNRLEVMKQSLDMSELIFMTEALYTDAEVVPTSIQELFIRLQRSVLEKKRADIKQALQQAEVQADTDRQDELLEQLAKIAQEIEKL